MKTDSRDGRETDAVYVTNRSSAEVLKRSFPNLPPHPDEAAPAVASGQDRKDSMRCSAGYDVGVDVQWCDHPLGHGKSSEVK